MRVVFPAPVVGGERHQHGIVEHEVEAECERQRDQDGRRQYAVNRLMIPAWTA
jgi:hypothetical protein